jgi:transposase
MASRTTTSDAERRWLRVLGTLNESQARLFVAEKALELGRGGISRLSELTGMSRPTIYKGAAQLRRKGQLQSAQAGRIRRGGAGRKRVEEVAPALKRELTRIVEETTAGDPMSLLKWTAKSTRTIAEDLSRRGYAVSAVTIGRCLHDMDYSLQANVKSLEGRQHPDRDAQFRHINAQVKAFLRSGDPVAVGGHEEKRVGGRLQERRPALAEAGPSPGGARA